jgi:phosphate transport system substrate-binding protein
MKLSRIHLLAACAASSFVANAAQASVLLPPVELRGVGATTVGDVTVRTLNCVGNPGNHVPGDVAGNRLNKYGTNSGSLATVEPGNFQPTTPTAASPAYNCETQEIQPDFEGKYVGTGSGFGRQQWRLFTNQFTGAAGNINPFGTWNNVQLAFSEAPAAVSDITAYNANANSAANKAGAAIQVPFFVIPIAFAYNPVYGTKSGVDYKFNAKFPQSVNGVVAGGIRLNKSAYCKIYNGEITNWNDSALQVLNGNQSLRDVNDNAARWTSEGAPIRLVGRADRSGGSDVFTRAMAAQCNGLVTVNKYQRAAESLPFDNTSTIDIRRLRGDSRYFPASATSNFANFNPAVPASTTYQSLGGLVYDRNTDVICKWDEVNNTTKVCDTAIAPGGVFTTAVTPGLFMVADGTSGVAEAIETNVNNTLLTSTVDPTVKLNGKLGYVGADFVKPVPGRNLFAAALQKGTTTAYVMPSATNASAAFGTVLPPQATASSGAYNPADTRTLGSVDPALPIDPATNPATLVNRANPLHWANILYTAQTAPGVAAPTLANPINGYPVTGAAFLLTYTCFKPANAAVPGNNAGRFGVVNYAALMLGKNTKNSLNQPVSVNAFKGTGATALGIFAQSNTAPLPGAWGNAVNDTFFKKGAGALGLLNLWIQDTLPTTASDVDAINQATDSKSNPTCDANFGA